MVANSNPALMLVDRKTSALVIVDIQAKLLPTMFEAPRVVRNCQILLRLGQLLGLPTILTTQYAKGLGNTNLEILEAAGNLEPLDKTSFGCFGDARFPRLLKEHAPQANTLLLAGIESHICVAQTALGALQAGYLVHVASDATSSRTAENWQVGLRRMERAGAVVTSTEMIAYELLRASNTPEFKALLPLIK